MKNKWVIVLLAIIFTACPTTPSITAVKLQSSVNTVAATQKLDLTLEVSGTGAFDPSVNWNITPNLGNITTNPNNTVIYNSPMVSSDTNIIIRATAKSDPSKYGETTIQIKAPTIGTITTAAAKTTLESEESTNITAKIEGTGAFNTNVSWEILSGGGSLSSSTANPVNYTAPKVGVDTDVVLQATAVGNPSKKQSIQLKVLTAKVVQGINLSATNRTLTSGTGSSEINAVVNGSGAIQNAVTWEIVGGGGILSNPTDTNVTYNAPATTQDMIVTVKATSKADPSKTDTITLIVIAPTVVNTIQINATSKVIKSNTTTTLNATISGTGNPNPNAKWEIVSGGGALSSLSGASVTYAPTVVTADTEVIIRATSSDDASKTTTITIVIEPIPTITGISLSVPSTTLQASTTTSLSASATGFGNPDLGIKWSIIGNQGTLSNATGANTTFTAPDVSSATTVQIKAESVQDSSKFALTEFAINPKPEIEVLVNPTSMTVDAGKTVALSAAVNHATNSNVTWSSTSGTLVPNGNSVQWTAPMSQVNTTATVTATSIENPNKKTSVSVTINALPVEVYTLPLHPAYNSAGFNFGTGTNQSSIAVAYGIHFHIAARAGTETIGGTWTSSNPNVVGIVATNAPNGSANLVRLVGTGIGSSAIITFVASNGQQRQVQVNVNAMTAKPLPTVCVTGTGGYIAIRPDGRYVMSGDLTGLGLPNVSGTVTESILGVATSRLLRGCVGGIYSVTLMTTDPQVSYASGDYIPTGNTTRALTEFSHCPILSVQQKYYTGHLVCSNTNGQAWGANFSGQFGANLPKDGTKRALQSNGGSGFAWIASTERFAVGMQWNGAAWATGDWFHNWGDNGGAGDSQNWIAVPELNGMVTCDLDNDLTMCIPPSRTTLIVHGDGTKGGRTGKIHYRPEQFSIPAGEIAVAVAVGQESVLLLTETGVFRRGVLRIASGQDSCNCWEKITSITGTPLEISAAKAWYILKTTTSAFRNSASGFSSMEAVNPDASFTADPPNINLLERVVGIVQIGLTGFSNNEFFATSRDTSVETELGNWVNGKRELRLHCIRAGVSTSVVITHKIFPNISREIPVTCTGNQNPRIVRFYELNNNLEPKPWDALKLQWQLEEPEGQSITCKLDLDDNGTWDHIQNNCNDGNNYNHVWNPNQTGARNIKLRVEDGYGGASERYLGFTVQSSNHEPSISIFTVTPLSGTAPLNVSYSWTVTDPDNDPLTCQLDATGDGTYEYSYACSSRSSQTYTFSSNGTYTSRFKVTDGRGGEVSATRVVSLGSGIVTPPPPNASGNVVPSTIYGKAKDPILFQINHSGLSGNVVCRVSLQGIEGEKLINPCPNGLKQFMVFQIHGSYRLDIVIENELGKTVKISTLAEIYEEPSATLKFFACADNAFRQGFADLAQSLADIGANEVSPNPLPENWKDLVQEGLSILTDNEKRTILTNALTWLSTLRYKFALQLPLFPSMLDLVKSHTFTVGTEFMAWISRVLIPAIEKTASKLTGIAAKYGVVLTLAYVNYHLYAPLVTQCILPLAPSNLGGGGGSW
jgi:hypothetical protein